MRELIFASIMALTVQPCAAPPAVPTNAMAEFQRLCVATKAEPTAIKATAINAGFKQDSHDPKQFMIGSPDRAMTVTYGASSVPAGDGRDTSARGCILYVLPGSPEHISQFHDWIGVSSLAPSPWAYDLRQDAKGRLHSIKGDKAARMAALYAGELRVAKIEQPSPEITTLTYIVVDTPAK